MFELYEIIKRLIVALIILIFILGIIFGILVAGVYAIQYIYDCIVWVRIKIVRFLEKKTRFKESILLKKLKIKKQFSKPYLRYETPLVTYCFSYIGIVIIVCLLPGKGKIIKFCFGMFLYLLFYFMGMSNLCGEDKKYYKTVLDNNMDFLKLSFLPIGFIITMGGFWSIIPYCIKETILSKGKSLFVNLYGYGDEFNILLCLKEIARSLFANLCEHGNEINIFQHLIVGLVVLIIFYILSLPVQVLSYFFISVINYCLKYEKEYKKLYAKFKLFILLVFRIITNSKEKGK